jgi:hypothetical protein
MSEGLIASYEGRLIICAIMLFLGVLACLVLTIITYSLRSVSDLVLAASALRGGHALVRGVAHDFANRHSTGWWFRRFLAVFVGGPLLGMVIVTGIEATNRLLGDPAPLAVLVAMALLVAVLVFGIRRMQVKPQPMPAALPPAPAPVPQPGYFLPDNADQWPR